jgi:hypothetical protein
MALHVMELLKKKERNVISLFESRWGIYFIDFVLGVHVIMQHLLISFAGEAV